MNRKNRFTYILVALTCVGLLTPKAFGVVPPPDGCYPNFTTAEGCKALQNLTTGVANTGIGWYSLFANSTGSYNTAIGAGALDVNNADSNTAVGVAALLLNTSGTNNTATGTGALVFNDSGIENAANGAFALFNNTDGNFNTAIGVQALTNNTTGGDNTAIGHGALFSNSTGEFNTALGQGALNQNTTGSTNVVIGAGAGGGVFTADNVICIGATVSGNNVSNTCFIGNIRSVTTHNANAIPVLIDSAGQLGTASSSARFKTDIKCMNNASETILALRPVTFHYKSDTTGTPQFGLIAEEVAKANPDLVVRDENGEIYTVRYDAVNAMLLNEFLKEHQTVQAQQKEIDALKQELKGQRALIEKVSARIDKAAAQLVADNL